MRSYKLNNKEKLIIFLPLIAQLTVKVVLSTTIHQIARKKSDQNLSWHVCQYYIRRQLGIWSWLSHEGRQKFWQPVKRARRYSDPLNQALNTESSMCLASQNRSSVLILVCSLCCTSMDVLLSYLADERAHAKNPKKNHLAGLNLCDNITYTIHQTL